MQQKCYRGAGFNCLLPYCSTCLHLTSTYPWCESSCTEGNCCVILHRNNIVIWLTCQLLLPRPYLCYSSLSAKSPYRTFILYVYKYNISDIQQACDSELSMVGPHPGWVLFNTSVQCFCRFLVGAGALAPQQLPVPSSSVPMWQVRCRISHLWFG